MINTLTVLRFNICERLWVLIAGVCATDDGINFTNKSIVVHCHMENGPVV